MSGKRTFKAVNAWAVVAKGKREPYCGECQYFIFETEKAAKQLAFHDDQIIRVRVTPITPLTRKAKRP